MQNINKSFFSIVQRYSNPKIGYLFIFLLILQFYLFPYIESKVQANYDGYANFLYFYAVCSYTIIVLGIIIFQLHKFEMLLDKFSLFLIAFTCFVRTRLQGGHELVYLLYFGSLGLVILVYVIKNYKQFKMVDKGSLSVAVLLSIGLLSATALLQLMFSSIRITSTPTNLLSYLLKELLYNISFITVIEEVCFRGLIVGFLAINGYKESTAFIFQAILFWGMHYMYLMNNPLWFFTGIPLLALSTTYVVSKYKTVFLSIIIHTSFNVFIYLFIFAFQGFFT